MYYQGGSGLEVLNPSQNSKGNVLFLILIAVALFAALSFAVVNSTRTGDDGGVQKTTDRLKAQQFIDFGDNVRLAVQRLRINGVSTANLDFGRNATGSNAVFHPDGGGAVWIEPPLNAQGPSGPYVWNFELPSGGWDVDGVGSIAPDTFIWIVGLSEGVCREINGLMGHASEIPLDSVGNSIVEAYEGEHAFCYSDGGQEPEFIYVLEAY